MRVRVLRPAHERHGGDDRPVAVLADDLLRAEAVEHGHDGRAGEAAGHRPERALEAVRLRRDDDEVTSPSAAASVEAPDARLQLAPPADPEPLSLERVRVLLPPRQHCHLADLRQMPGEQAADHPPPTMQTRSIMPWPSIRSDHPWP